MLIQPKELVTESLATTVKETKASQRKTRSNDPTIAAEALTTKEDLALYYPAMPNREATAAAVVTATMAAVAAAAVGAELHLAKQVQQKGKGGHSIQASPELMALPAGEISTMSVEELVKIRKTAL